MACAVVHKNPEITVQDKVNMHGVLCKNRCFEIQMIDKKFFNISVVLLLIYKFYRNQDRTVCQLSLQLQNQADFFLFQFLNILVTTLHKIGPGTELYKMYIVA